MKANELRIGNIVEFSTPKLPLNIHELSHIVTAEDIVNFENGKILLTPVPLTEEWLKKLGFKYSEERASMSNGFEEWENNGVYIGPLDNEKYVCDALDQGGISMYILYVHQLQNLYFALTGQELI